MATEKLIQLANERECSGCGACVNVCPTGSIIMRPVDDSLHLYPSITETTCIKCGKCMTTCPVLTIKYRESPRPTQHYYCAWNKSLDQRRLSTSGGVGSAIVNEALNRGYYVAGVKFDDHWHVEHVVTNDVIIANQFRGSKYLQSDTSTIYKKIKHMIYGGEKVLFVGTPCQIDAVKSVVPKADDKLLTCGIICHGVNAPVVWSDFVEYLQNKKHGVLKSYNFRSKKKGWGKLYIDYEMTNGKQYTEPAWKNLFHVWFGQHYMMRESCFHCAYRKEERYSDLVIGDFWGIEKVLPQLETKDGASVLITTTEQGQQFVDNLDCLELIRVDAKKTPTVLKGFLAKKGNEVKLNTQLESMHRFAAHYHSKTFAEMAKLYPCPTRWDLLVASLKHHIGKKR
mgnify:CR=1 FL=1